MVFEEIELSTTVEILYEVQTLESPLNCHHLQQ